MKDHDVDNDFLDNLYSDSAKEVPSVALDQAILKQAHDNVRKGNFLQRLQWQQFFSVAAVLVLSVYIVLDVGDQSLGIDDFSLTEQIPRIEELRLKSEKAKAKKVMDSAVYESAAEFDEVSLLQNQEKSEEVEAKQVRRSLITPSNVQEISIDQGLSTQTVSAQAVSTQVSDDESFITRPEQMIEEIERLIADGKLVDAQKVYKEFTDAYPEYSVPSRIIKALK